MNRIAPRVQIRKIRQVGARLLMRADNTPPGAAGAVPSSTVRLSSSMSTHVKQHCVPTFLLEHRHSGADEKLSALRGAHRKLDSPRFKAKSVARLAPPAQFSVGANSLAAW